MDIHFGGEEGISEREEEKIVEPIMPVPPRKSTYVMPQKKAQGFLGDVNLLEGAMPAQ